MVSEKTREKLTSLKKLMETNLVDVNTLIEHIEKGTFDTLTPGIINALNEFYKRHNLELEHPDSRDLVIENLHRQLNECQEKLKLFELNTRPTSNILPQRNPNAMHRMANAIKNPL